MLAIREAEITETVIIRIAKMSLISSIHFKETASISPSNPPIPARCVLIFHFDEIAAQTNRKIEMPLKYRASISGAETF